MSLTYTLEQVEQVLARFAPDLLGAEFRARCHDLCKAGSGLRQLGSSVSSARSQEARGCSWMELKAP